MYTHIHTLCQKHLLFVIKKSYHSYLPQPLSDHKRNTMTSESLSQNATKDGELPSKETLSVTGQGSSCEKKPLLGRGDWNKFTGTSHQTITQLLHFSESFPYLEEEIGFIPHPSLPKGISEQLTNSFPFPSPTTDIPVR
ncbi:UNVERIFIED_CONTAM: hypothetical protein K2H54_014225 [Gekko kuhli]